ncbi:Protein ELC-like protein [Morus notabilis]|uniref:Protein ELC-like protein n=1 Tax=Morus notabilis TaxID=981085 RepID=W9QCK8_9ROSA|nr:protein ELC [Morus notabilis]EXB26560.1 Protein ELC-like protein [Morus notabilis]
MASPTAIQFIELALFNSNTTTFNLSYSDPHQKWIIRNHLLSLLQEFPTFSPSFGTFVHNDGTAVTLLCVIGDLRVTASTPPVPLTIWLHQNHPLTPPMVFVATAESKTNTIRNGHPFVHSPSGSTTCPYLETWAHPRCSLSSLVRNLAKLFSHDHPFVMLSHKNHAFAHVSLVSKREALDRLVGSVHYDVASFTAAAERERLALAELRAEMVERVNVVERVIIGGLEEEKKRLKMKVLELTEQADVVMNWLRVNYDAVNVGVGDEGNVEKAFEGVDDDGGGDSEKLLDCLAADRAVEDVIYALDKAVEEGVVSLEGYIKQVRALAREQFYHRAMLVKLRGSATILHWPC